MEAEPVKVKKNAKPVTVDDLAALTANLVIDKKRAKKEAKAAAPVIQIKSKTITKKDKNLAKKAKHCRKTQKHMRF